MLTYDFRLPPGPRTVEYAILAENLGFRAVWCPEIPAFGHDIWVTLARIAERTRRIKFGPSVLIPSYRHPMAQASAIATLEQIAPGRLMVGFGTGFTGRAGMGKKPLSLALASVERADENVRHLSIHRGHSLDISNGHDALVDISAAKQMTFTGTREELRERLAQLETRGATGIIFGTSGYDVERELRAYAEVAGLR